MRVSIEANRGQHNAPHDFTHHMTVDNHGLLVDLSGIQHSVVNAQSFNDPQVSRVEWGLHSLPDGRGGTRMVEGGTVYLRGGSTQSFFDRTLLDPYLAVYEKTKSARLDEAEARARRDELLNKLDRGA
jgi:hypothetical protein